MTLSINAIALICRVLPAALTGSVQAPPVSELRAPALTLPKAVLADSDEAGRVFRFEGGHRSDVKPASILMKAAGVACPREAFSCGTSVAPGQAAMLVPR